MNECISLIFKNSSDWESSSEMEGETKMLFEACSMEDPEIKPIAEHGFFLN